MFGFVRTFNSETGIGWLQPCSNGRDLLFVSDPSTNFAVGQRVEYLEGSRAVNVTRESPEHE